MSAVRIMGKLAKVKITTAQRGRGRGLVCTMKTYDYARLPAGRSVGRSVLDSAASDRHTRAQFQATLQGRLNSGESPGNGGAAAYIDRV